MHASLKTRVKTLSGAAYSMVAKLPANIDALKHFYKIEYDGKEFEHAVYTEEKIRSFSRVLIIVTVLFYTLVILLLVGVAAILWLVLSTFLT